MNLQDVIRKARTTPIILSQFIIIMNHTQNSKGKSVFGCVGVGASTARKQGSSAFRRDAEGVVPYEILLQKSSCTLALKRKLR